MAEYKIKANLIRALSIISTTQTASGHPTSCMSAADIAAVLFDSYFTYDISNPGYRNNDRFILSKGHAAPLLYSAFSLAGAFPRSELLTLRKFKSVYEGHPTPRWKYAEISTGSLGQGVSVAAGIALLAKKEGLTHKTFVLTGDGELAEGQIYEAINFSSHYKLDNLIIIADINGLAQTGPTMFDHNLEHYRSLFSSLGCVVEVIDGHNYEEINNSLLHATSNSSQKPFLILAKTIKGKGVSFLENKVDYHGKAVKKEEMNAALEELEVNQNIIESSKELFSFKKPSHVPEKKVQTYKNQSQMPQYTIGDLVATREAFGQALADLASTMPDLYVFDGDMSNSTFTDIFQKVASERFVQGYIAEQNMVSVAAGFVAMKKHALLATFGAFLTRAHDQIRMAHLSSVPLKIVGSHAGISIGEDGPSQMALDDISMYSAFPHSVVLHPCDGISTYKLLPEFLTHKELSYLRTLRVKTPVLYKESEDFTIGGSKVLRSSPSDELVIVAAGVTVFEALKAYEELKKQGSMVCVIDAYSIKPLDTTTIKKHITSSKHKVIITVEDHYKHGGLGDMVLSEFSKQSVSIEKLGVDGIPFSGDTASLLSEFKIDSHAIIDVVKKTIKR